MSPDASGIYSIPGFDYAIEMKHFSDAGISNYDILKATSYNFATMLGEEENRGAIKVGQHTDLLLLTENPLEDIENASKIEGVIKDGKYLLRKEIMGLLNQPLKLMRHCGEKEIFIFQTDRPKGLRAYLFADDKQTLWQNLFKGNPQRAVVHF